MLSVIMLSVIMLNVIILSVIMLSVIMLSVIMQSFIMLSVIMLSVVIQTAVMNAIIWNVELMPLFRMPLGYSYAECQYEYHCAERNYTECHYTDYLGATFYTICLLTLVKFHTWAKFMNTLLFARCPTFNLMYLWRNPSWPYFLSFEKFDVDGRNSKMAAHFRGMGAAETADT
jgi:hypothetical protein